MESILVSIVSVVLNLIATVDSLVVTPFKNLTSLKKKEVITMFETTIHFIANFIAEVFGYCVTGLVDLGVAIKEYFVDLYCSFINGVVDRYHRTINWFCKLPMRIVMCHVRLLLRIWKYLVETYRPCVEGLKDGFDALMTLVLSTFNIAVPNTPKLIIGKVYEPAKAAAIIVYQN